MDGNLCEFRRALLLVLTTGLIVGIAADMAEARGGSRGGRAHGPKGALLKQTTPSLSGATPAATAPADPAAATGKISPGGISAIAAGSALPPAPTAPAAPPASVIGTPATPVPAIAPLSQPVVTTILTAGGTATVNSSSPSSTSPTEAAPSIAGGGGKSLQDCMGFWDRGTHMTKGEWKAACLRSQHRLDGIERDVIELNKTQR